MLPLGEVLFLVRGAVAPRAQPKGVDRVLEANALLECKEQTVAWVEFEGDNKGRFTRVFSQL